MIPIVPSAGIRTILAIFVVGVLDLVTVMPSTAQIGTRSWVAAHQGQIVGELVELLAIPNVAADRQNIRRNADHLRAMLERRGFAAELIETTGNPLVYGELKVPTATRTLLLYAHYDGQPVEPKAWQQPCSAERRLLWLAGCSHTMQ